MKDRRVSVGRLLAALMLLAHPAAAQEIFAERQEDCAGCHGENGASEVEGVPSLGGIEEYYALLQLVAFRGGNRKDEIMQDMVGDMSDNDLRAAAAWIAGLEPPPAPAGTADRDLMQRGKSLATENRCDSCHGADYRGGHQMPPLRNQRADYLEKALGDYKAERRIGDRAAMVEIVQDLSDEDIAVLAKYLEALPAQ